MSQFKNQLPLSPPQGKSVSKKHFSQRPAQAIEPPAAPPPVDDSQSVKKHLRCPLCWDNYRGRAARRKWHRQVSGPLQKRCYTCDKCGTEWVVDVRYDESDEGVMIKTANVTEVRLLSR